MKNSKSPSEGLKGSKILIITSEFPPQPGGIGNHALNLANGLQKNGYEVKVICDIRSAAGAEEKDFDKNLPFEVIRISRKKIPFFIYYNRISAAFFNMAESEFVILSGKFSLWMGGLLSLFFKRKYVAIIHGNEVQISNKMLRWITNRCLQNFDLIIPVSNYTKSLVDHLKLKRVEVIFNGFNINHPKVGMEKNEPAPVLVTVGNVTKRKGQQNVIRALPVLLKKYPDLRYNIVGIPTQQAKLEKLALQLGVEEAVVFMGMVTEEEKMLQLQQADIFVMLSETKIKGDVEGFGIAILEANAVGIPAIGAEGCGIEDAINNKVSGRLIDPKNSKEFLSALTEILESYKSYSRGAETWSKNFTWQRVIKNYIKVFKKLN